MRQHFLKKDIVIAGKYNWTNLLLFPVKLLVQSIAFTKDERIFIAVSLEQPGHGLFHKLIYFDIAGPLLINWFSCYDLIG